METTVVEWIDFLYLAVVVLMIWTIWFLDRLLTIRLENEKRLMNLIWDKQMEILACARDRLSLAEDYDRLRMEYMALVEDYRRLKKRQTVPAITLPSLDEMEKELVEKQIDEKTESLEKPS